MDEAFCEIPKIVIPPRKEIVRLLERNSPARIQASLFDLRVEVFDAGKLEFEPLRRRKACLVKATQVCCEFALDPRL